MLKSLLVSLDPQEATMLPRWNIYVPTFKPWGSYLPG